MRDLPWTGKKAFWAATWFGLGLIVGGVWWRMVGGSAHTAEALTGYMIVGLKGPAAPVALKTLAGKLKGKIVRVAPGGVFLLVKPRPGVTAQQLKDSSSVIAYVEPEVVMGLVEPARDALLVIDVPPPRLLPTGPPRPRQLE
jgi:hypothetical protein